MSDGLFTLVSPVPPRFCGCRGMDSAPASAGAGSLGRNDGMDNPSDCCVVFEDWAPFSNGVTRVRFGGPRSCLWQFRAMEVVCWSGRSFARFLWNHPPRSSVRGLFHSLVMGSVVKMKWTILWIAFYYCGLGPVLQRGDYGWGFAFSLVTPVPPMICGS